MRRTARILATISILGGAVGALPAAAADENVMIVFDGSNSMWGQIDGVAKIEIARGVMENLLGEWTETREVGLMAYGHRRRGDCSDIEMLVKPGEDTRAGILAGISGITPTGKTPLTDAVEQAASILSYTDEPATVVLISDGVESCERDPCALSEALEEAGVGFTAHVVGFGLGDEDASALSCIADSTGGQYLSANDADELSDALSAVGTAVAAESEPEPEYDVTVNAPDTALAGSAFEVSWTGTVVGSDYITIVPAGADEGTRDNHFRVRDHSTKKLRAPGETGLYEVRYVLEEGHRTLVSQPIEVLPEDAVLERGASLDAPESAPAGSTITLGWSSESGSGDQRVAIARPDQAIFVWVSAVRLEDSSPVQITLPEEPGLYELRFLDIAEQNILARRMIEVE